jgi:hypothetical protein
MKKRVYTHYFIRRGKAVQSIKDIATDSWRSAELFLYCNDEYVGSGSILRYGKNVQTESTGLLPKKKKQGHGIHLYMALIAEAKKLGVNRIYSSRHLNRLSRRMWEKKLKATKTRGSCLNACSHCKRNVRFYLTLKVK